MEDNANQNPVQTRVPSPADSQPKEPIQPQTTTVEPTQVLPTTPSPTEQPEQQEITKPKNKRVLILIVVLILLGLVVLGYWVYNKQYLQSQSIPEKQSVATNTPEYQPVAINTIVDANNQFALDYYSKLKDKGDSNIFYSPFSISSAIAMTFEGARGQTAEEILSVFHFPSEDDIRQTEYLEIYSEINKNDKKYELKIANALWVQEEYQFSKIYLDTIEKYYNGKATNLDFTEDPEGSRITINNWVEKETANKIKDLIPSGLIDKLTRLVLTNAIYFKGEWEMQFNEEETKSEDFRINSNNSVKVSMMQRTDEEAKFNYTENDMLQVLEIPYSGDDLSMLIILPKSEDLSTIEDILNTSNLAGWQKGLVKQRVKVFIPKFTFETKYSMADDLKAMGMPIAFTWPGANFSGMDGGIDLYIGDVFHQAFIEVNEEGTEAAAATAVMMALGAAPNQNVPEIPVFRADHPFIFLIQHNLTGNILFIGRVANPVAK